MASVDAGAWSGLRLASRVVSPADPADAHALLQVALEEPGTSVTGGTPFGVEAIEGAEAVVLEKVDADHGMVKIDGEMWSARSFDTTETYQPGDHVRVVKLRGATALVWREGVTHQLPAPTDN